MKEAALKNSAPTGQSVPSERNSALHHASGAATDGIIVTSALCLAAACVAPLAADGYYATGVLTGTVTSLLATTAFCTAAIAVNTATETNADDLAPAEAGRWRKVGVALTLAFSLATGVPAGTIVHKAVEPSGKNFMHWVPPQTPFGPPMFRFGKEAPSP